MSFKTELRNNAARLLDMIGLTAPGRRADGRLSVATFHRVLPEANRRAYPYPGLVVTPEELDGFLEYFSSLFDCGTLARQHARHVAGETAQRPLLAITFDDGQHDNHRHARPVLAKHGIKASFFIPVEAVERRELLWHDRLGFAVLALLAKPGGRDQLINTLADVGLDCDGPGSPVENVVGASKGLSLESRLLLVATLGELSGQREAPGFARMMTFDEIAELAADGHEIGSHSMTHCLMTECGDQALAREVGESRAVLEKRLGLEIESFCYPNGNADVRTAAAVAAAGYRRAVTTEWGSNNHTADGFRLRRCDMDAARVRDPRGRIVGPMLAWRMSGFYPGLR